MTEKIKEQTFAGGIIRTHKTVHSVIEDVDSCMFGTPHISQTGSGL